VPSEEHADGTARPLKHAADPLDDLRAVGELADDPNLHVVDDQRHAFGIAGVRQGVGDAELAVVLHWAPFGVGLAADGRRAVVGLGGVDLAPE
jgi:hypothetical protein